MRESERTYPYEFYTLNENNMIKYYGYYYVHKYKYFYYAKL